VPKTRKHLGAKSEVAVPKTVTPVAPTAKNLPTQCNAKNTTTSLAECLAWFSAQTVTLVSK